MTSQSRAGAVAPAPDAGAAGGDDPGQVHEAFMADRVAAFDWATTRLGPRSRWPVALRVAVDIVLGSPVPMILLWGRDGIMIYNDGYARIAGRRHPGILGRPVLEGWPEVADWNARVLEVGFAGGTLSVKDQPFTLHRGATPEEVWLDLDYSPVRGDDGEVAGVLAIVVETTQRVRADQALAESDSRFRKLADNAPVMVWLTGPEGEALYVSRSWCELTGQSPEAGLGFGWFEAIHPDDAPRVRELFHSSQARREAFSCEYRLRRHDGVYRWALDTATPRFDSNGQLVGYIGSVIDITERKESEQRQNLLMREVDHRAKNVLAVVQAVLRLSRADTAQGYREVVEGRIASLARAHSLLAASRWKGVELRQLLKEELAPYVAGREERLRLDGPDLLLSADTAQSIALVLHELSTNAAKHGALSEPTGTIDISWRATPELSLSLEWRETTQREVRPPEALGFGSELIRSSVRRQLGGEISKEWRPSGMICRLSIPAQFEQQPVAAQASEGHSRLRALLVEDDAIIAMDMEGRLAELGCELIGTAGSIDTARALIAQAMPDFALLDANLSGTSSVPLAGELVAAGVQVVFCSGYEDIKLPEELQSLPRLIKPVSDDDLQRALAAAAKRAGRSLG